MSLLIAVDPGAHGALAYSLDGREPSGLLSLANHDLIQLYLRLQSVAHLVPENEKRLAFIEENTGFIAGSPRTGSSMFRFGQSTGRLEMALAALQFELHRVRPRAWQKALGCPPRSPGEPPRLFKSHLATFARERVPQLNARITRENADALLILLYALKKTSNVP